MDTKSRSIKPALAFWALFFGVNLLILALATGYSAVHTLGWHGISDAFQSDYQNTADFRRTISQWFYSFADPDWQEHYQLSDQNLLYKVTKDGQTVTTNVDGLSPDALPEGYNFLLYFDGETVTIQKDGQEIDIYGDGYYRGEDQWNLPGYHNIPVPQSYAGLTITMAVAKEPVAYIADTAALTGDVITDSGLYSTMDYAARLQLPLILFVVVPLVVGTVLLLWSILWHKHKVRADQAIAWFTGKIWLEVKLVLLIPFFLACIAAFFCLVSLYTAHYYTIWFYLSVPVALWWAYLYLNDLRYNFGHITANSLCALLARLYRGGELSWPAGQRMMRRSALQFLAAVPFILGCIVVFFLLFGPTMSRLPIFFLLLLLALAGLFLIAAQLWLMSQNRRTAADVDTLLSRIQAAGTGQASAAPLPQDSDLRAAVEGLDQMESHLPAPSRKGKDEKQEDQPRKSVGTVIINAQMPSLFPAGHRKERKRIFLQHIQGHFLRFCFQFSPVRPLLHGRRPSQGSPQHFLGRRAVQILVIEDIGVFRLIFQGQTPQLQIQLRPGGRLIGIGVKDIHQSKGKKA